MSDQIMKKTADELLKIADDIDKDAAEVTTFVCDKCNHTATLAGINAKRQAAAKAASEATGETVVPADITVNDKIHCPACAGLMAYKATEASEAYYFDPDKKADDKPGETPAEEKAEKEKDEKEAKKNPDAPHSEKTETPEAEKGESLETQKKEQEKGVHASVDYDSLKRYTA
jgi:outer membrane biosynthesis protein TonB